MTGANLIRAAPQTRRFVGGALPPVAKHAIELPDLGDVFTGFAGRAG